MPPHLLRRIGGGLLIVAGLVVLAGPVQFLVWGSHTAAVGGAVAHDPKALTGLTYQITLGLMIGLIGFYLLTRTPKPKI
jgi:hypothetical protein